MLSLIIPVYRNEASIPELLAELQGLHQALAGALEVVFVVDGSPDRCHELLRTLLPRTGLDATLVLLTRNFGAFAAVRMGLQQARGDTFAVMAADLQEPPELVLRMQAVLADGAVDVVVAERTLRHDPFWQRWQAALFWSLYRRYVVPEMPPGGVDIFACNRAFRDALLDLGESRSSLIAQIFWLGFRRAGVPYERQPRRHGQSAWTWRKKLAYLADSVFAFTDLPVRLLTRVGALGLLVAAVLGVVVLFGKLSGLIGVPGYAMTLIAILFFGALNLLSLGIVGTYAWRAYENTKQRPQAIALRVDRFESR
ncbi:MAG TPA: glycosyltransferase family 2 protein [Ottowia sp.]|nr:MAG: glycosyltransferase [Burkholderiales bacterium 68-10]HMT64526.1 glycosyltransferase family 2 protein [Ottowia sp.]HMT81917.1 glycosyltransferase family 2 protein [Ottowia sp.]HPP97132.1 glycosyltransferase family 2 protein [Ottowia sp.]HQX67553.1 glycosyltransferase family 2 protein [Ottowia sp.]